MNIRCYLFGHRISDFRPDGHDLCDRCGATNHPAYQYVDVHGNDVKHKFEPDGVLRIDWMAKRVYYRLKDWWTYKVRPRFQKSQLPF